MKQFDHISDLFHCPIVRMHDSNSPGSREHRQPEQPGEGRRVPTAGQTAAVKQDVREGPANGHQGARHPVCR